jgi:hypothetical protein
MEANLARRVTLRHRAPGHLRFALPAELCEPGAAPRLEAAVQALPGVRRARVARGSRRLAIHYLDTLADAGTIARGLLAAVQTIEGLPACCRREPPEEGRVPRGWLHGKVQEARETLTAARLIATGQIKHALPWLPEPEKLIGEFFLDALVLYLIRVHWHRITQDWLVSPWRYRYEWLAVTYLMYLFVKSKRPA